MAGEGSAEADLPAHQQTYSSFISIAKAGTVACFLIAMVVVFLIAR